MWGAHDGMGWWMLFGSVAWVLFVLIVVYAAAVLPNRDSGRIPDNRETPLEIAQRRYAAGEISEEQFQRIKRELDS